MINDILRNKDLDSIVITSPENLYYFSGFTGGEGFLVLTPEKNYIIVDGRYTIQAKQQTKGFEVVEYKQSAYKEIANLKFRNIGFEDKTISYNSYSQLKNALENPFLTGISDEVSDIRKIKKEDFLIIKIE